MISSVSREYRTGAIRLMTYRPIISIEGRSNSLAPPPDAGFTQRDGRHGGSPIFDIACEVSRESLPTAIGSREDCMIGLCPFSRAHAKC